MIPNKAKTTSIAATTTAATAACSTRSGSQVGQLTATADGMSNPQGTDVGKKGHWYIANTGASNIPEYSPGGAKLIQTLNDSGNYPVDVATHPHGVVVSNIYTTSFTAGTVDVYNGNSTNPQLQPERLERVPGHRRDLR